MRKNSLLLLFFILVGSILGGIIGEGFGHFVPFLTYGQTIGFSPVKVDLSFIQLTLGFQMKLTLAGIIGLLVGIILFRKLG